MLAAFRHLKETWSSRSKSQKSLAKERIPKFKKRAVSAVRDWLLGCGPASEQHLRQIAVVLATDSVNLEGLILTVIRG
ncbi:hypothetical protein EPI10_015895 [Gossypium australe]|uniref:Uncharacterized protein n=1 Tax=Gossypium australe TaxID=47621 RepID=A0A5B6VM66_9ROSI|nr:hypothetical protein EPI10_015895 [Gossypium australe]